jgi:DHA2 family multidrug resistance protein
VAVELRRKEPLLQLRLLGRRNFGLGTFGNFLLGFALYGAAYLLPQYLANSQGLDSEQVGAVVAWTGLPQLVVIPFVPRLMRRIDSRILVGGGLIVFAVSCFMNVYLNNNYSAPQLFLPDIVRALGQALILTPLASIAMIGIVKSEAGSASALFNMLRNLGGAIGTAVLETFFTRREQFHSFVIGGHVSGLQFATQSRLTQLQQYFMVRGVSDPAFAMQEAIVAIGNSVRAQATLMGYADCFGLLGAILVLAALTVAMLKKGGAAAAGAH